MTRLANLSAIFATMVFAAHCVAAEPSAPPTTETTANETTTNETTTNETIAAFRLPDVQEQPIEVAPQDDARLTVVCFLGNECPLAKLYAPRLNAMSATFADRGVRFFGVNSNRHDSLEEIQDYMEKHGLKFPLLKDYQNKVADDFGASRTPEVFVLDKKFVVRYQGRIDNQYEPGISRATATEHELRNAIEELLDGSKVSVTKTDAEGCLIGRVRKPTEGVVSNGANKVTYCKQVARVLRTHCVECHRVGEIGPFVLDDYEEVAGWADMMLEVIDDGRMPPWHASPKHGEFANARRISDEDKSLLHAWVAAGTPYGDAADLPATQSYKQGWRLPREPDLVVAMGDNAFSVPAEGTVDYQYFVVDPGLTEDKWVVGAEVVPGNPGVVHHSIVFVRPPDGTDTRGFGWLAAYVPGQQTAVFPKGLGQLVPAGSKLVFQQHYTPNGTAQDDVTKLGLLFGDAADITHETYTILGIDQKFEIPPHQKDYVVHSKVHWLPERGTLLGISPHMHLRGKSFQLTMHQDEQSQILLDVPQYDFNWQHAYALKEPLPLADVDRLEFDFVFDNSDANPVNPNPAEFVMWGDQTYEEMAVVFFQVSQPIEDEKSEEVTDDGEEDVEATVEIVESSKKNDPSPEVKQRMEQEATKMLADFDANKDGKVTKSETPWIFRRHQFRSIDSDGDAILTKEEIEAAARWRVRR